MLLLQCNNVNEIFKTFQNKFLSIIDNNAPIITLSRKESKLRQKPWLTKCILESIRIKNQFYERHIKKKARRPVIFSKKNSSTFQGVFKDIF